MTVIGVDLRATAKRLSTAVGLDDHLKLVKWDTFARDAELLELVVAQQPSVVAIGSPLTLPSGLCCLDSTCECALALPQAKGRLCEIELSRLGISCFYTNKWSIIRDLINRGVQLKHRLNELGFHVIEVFPHATKVMLFGDNLPRKKSAQSLPFLEEKLTTLIPDFDGRSEALDHNTCDAALSAYTGFLYLGDGTDCLGSPGEGVVIIPKLPR